MQKNEVDRVKYSTYISIDILRAVKNLAHTKGVTANQVVEAALRKCLPEKYYPEKG